MDRTEWPTEGKLQDLREQGRVPWTPFGTSCIAAALGLFVIMGTAQLWRKAGARWLEVIDSGDLPAGLPILKELPLLFLSVPIAVLVAAALAGLLQTRFLILPGLLNFDLNRVNPLVNSSGLALIRMLINLCLLWMLLVMLALLLWWLLLPVLAGLLKTDSTIAAGWLLSTAGLAIPIISAALALSAVAAWLLARFRFMLRNRMSRAELEAEAREG